MTRRIAAVAAVLTGALLAAGCGGGGSAPSASGLGSASQSRSAGAGVSVAPSNAPPAGPGGSGGSGGSGGPGASGASGSSGGGQRSVGALPTPNGNTGLGSLPEGFPLPEGTTLGRIAVSKTDITAPLEVPDGAAAAVFWKKELPVAGYKIASDKVSKGIGMIKFTGNGCKTGSDVDISDEHVAFLCRR